MWLVLNSSTWVRKHKHPPEQVLLWWSDSLLTPGCWIGKYLGCIWAVSRPMGEADKGTPRVWSSPCCSRVTPWRQLQEKIKSQALFVSSQQAPRTRIPLLALQPFLLLRFRSINTLPPKDSSSQSTALFSPEAGKASCHIALLWGCSYYHQVLLKIL